MAVKTKGRRKIVVADRPFVWYVGDDRDSNDHILHVVSHDKAFSVNYHLEQPEQIRHLAVVGREFPGLADAGRCWKRVLCPRFEEGGAVTPSGVRRLIEWCLTAERELVEVDYRGQPLPT